MLETKVPGRKKADLQLGIPEPYYKISQNVCVLAFRLLQISYVSSRSNHLHVWDFVLEK